MLVLYVINSLGPGGAERSLAEMLPGLADRGIAGRVVCFTEVRGGVQRSVVGSGAPVGFLRAKSFPGRIRELRSIIGRTEPDVVHTTIFEADVIGRLSALRTGRRLVTSLVNTSYEPERLADPNVSRLKLEAARRVDRATVRITRPHFHAVSEAVKESAVRRLGVPTSHIDVIPRGRDRGRLGAPSPDRRRTARRRFSIAPADTMLLSVGRQEYQKDQLTLLRALPLLERRIPRLRLLVAGREGNATDDLRATVSALRLERRVRFLGHTEDVPDLLAAADVFAFPSRYEGFGGALIEALALGTPIVASDIPPTREVCPTRRHALLFTPGSTSELADRVEQVVADSGLRSAMSAVNRERFESTYSLESVVDRMASMYRRVVK